MIEHKTIEPETKTAIVMSRDVIDALRRVVDLIAGGEGVIRLEPAPEPEPEPDPEPAWPTAPLVWWDGKAWVQAKLETYFGDSNFWGKYHLNSETTAAREGARRFAREAVPVTLVPTEAWETWLEAVAITLAEAEYIDSELIDAVDSLAQEVAR